MTPGTSSLGPLKVLRDCQQLLRDSGLKETSDVDDDGRVDPGQKTAPTLVSLAELPSNGAASQADFPSQRQLARHLARRSGPAASLREWPVGDQLPLMLEALARGRAAGQTPYKADLTKGSTWSRDRNGAPPRPDAATALPPDGRTVPPMGANRSAVTSLPSPSANGLG